MHPLLAVKQLSIAKRHDTARHYLTKDVAFAVMPGKTLAILGCSGSGKTLTALAIAGLLPPQLGYLKGGEIIFENINLLTTPEWQLQTLRAAHIAYLFQEPATAFDPIMTIGEQMDEVLCCHKRLTRKERYQHCIQGLLEVGLTAECYHLYPHQLSGGMKQRALLAVMLLAEPKLLIADEVTSALDSDSERHILTLLKDLQNKRNFTIILITHNKTVARDYADDVAVFYRGEIVEIASSADFFAAPKHPYSQQLVMNSMQRLPSSPLVTTPILSIQGLTVDYPIRKGAFRRCVSVTHAVIDVNFELFPGRTLAVVGTSGSGKSSIAKALFSLVKSQNQRILWQGQAITLRELLGKMQLIFQDPAAALNPRMTIAQILKENFKNTLGEKSTYQDKMHEVILAVGLEPDSLCRYPHEFSGGQRQRICIARALMAPSTVWVLDEATSALDSIVKSQILTLLKSLQTTKNLAYLFISHDWDAIHFIADDMAVMKQGRFVEYTRNCS